MENLFFHNRHDKESINALASIPEGTKVIDVFEIGTVIPEGYKVVGLPYLVDKHLAYTGQEIYAIDQFPATVTLTWECRKQDESLIATSEPEFFVSVNGQREKRGKPVNGILEVDVEVHEPVNILVEILNDGNGYHPYKGTVQIEVTDNVG